MKSHKWLLLLCGMITLQLCLPARAIVNVEQAIIGKPEEGVNTTVDLSANGASGNVEKSAVRAEMLSIWQHTQYTEYMQLQYAYGKSNGKVDTDRAFSHLRHRTDISPAWGVEVYAQAGKDPFARLAQRILLGGGMRSVLFEEELKFAGYLGLGAFHEREALNSKLGTTDALHVKLWRANAYLVLKYQFNDQVRLYNTAYYQPALGDSGDYRVLDQLSILVKLGENLNLKASLDIAFDSRPPQGVEKRDMLYSTGLEYSF